ncbi:hypothetical protein GLOTRDRAFT_111299 [Gloeophyllum trabeum ATCC 11539]|uniref:Uncharacterized protein n=1 Tax=Gloeophyllum trabeum (strain ATCC 11539 / FP-39264 / Madison 617) TaxID=670483 RepID=S7RJK3_GLOTA|nr:uncharacterized protein GLOTRDRAFT_111299 [Gloeophyllum trabeum ATCC 11539]EPQ54510.1 hypothetical protein GLOTRDRAFT_111299 [Gloeophyllum trabeum ATCC 11539]
MNESIRVHRLIEVIPVQQTGARRLTSIPTTRHLASGLVIDMRLGWRGFMTWKQAQCRLFALGHRPAPKYQRNVGTLRSKTYQV